MNIDLWTSNALVSFEEDKQQLDLEQLGLQRENVLTETAMLSNRNMFLDDDFVIFTLILNISFSINRELI